MSLPTRDPHTLPLFDEPMPSEVVLAPGALLLRRFALDVERALLADIASVVAAAPFRRMVTPGGFTMSVEMTNCGALGWVTDRAGYRYSPVDPLSSLPWPTMPASFSRLATAAASRAGFSSFVPDACLVNRYTPGAKMSLHQDKNERDFGQPIVSVSLGLPALFLFGGDARVDRPTKIALLHGDVVVWGGPARLRYHGVATVKAGGTAHRINLTLRRAA